MTAFQSRACLSGQDSHQAVLCIYNHLVGLCSAVCIAIVSVSRDRAVGVDEFNLINQVSLSRDWARRGKLWSISNTSCIQGSTPRTCAQQTRAALTEQHHELRNLETHCSHQDLAHIRSLAHCLRPAPSPPLLPDLAPRMIASDFCCGAWPRVNAASCTPPPPWSCFSRSCLLLSSSM